MPLPIFPTSITEFSTESLIKRHSTKSKAIYWLLILSVVLFASAMFWIKVDVNVHSRGLITSQELTTNIIAPVYGEINNLQIKENQFVNTGDTLLQVDTVEIKKSIRITLENISVLEKQNADLQYLCSFSKTSFIANKKLHTELYSKELQKFISDLRYQKAEIAVYQKEYNRQKKLYEKEVVPLIDYEHISYKYSQSKLMYDKIFDNQLSQWQNQLFQNQNQILSFNQRINELQKEQLKYFITAPISGYIQKLAGIKKSGLIYTNQEICSISPNSDLIVETYVSTMDIGLIKTHQKVKLRVDAFNFNQWGMLEGQVIEIAKDIQVSDQGIPTFKIRCKLKNTTLAYQNKTVSVKKGMTVNANFLLSQRTLSQLLYDKVTDWLDPNQIK